MLEILGQIAAIVVTLVSIMFWFFNRFEKDIGKIHEDMQLANARHVKLIDKMDEQMNRMDARMDILSNQMNARMEGLNNRMDAHEKRIDQLYTMFIDLVKLKQ